MAQFAIMISPAAESDVPAILAMIRELAEYEKLSHLVVATADSWRRDLFGERRHAEVLIGRIDGEPVGHTRCSSTATRPSITPAALAPRFWALSRVPHRESDAT